MLDTTVVHAPIYTAILTAVVLVLNIADILSTALHEARVRKAARSNDACGNIKDRMNLPKQGASPLMALVLYELLVGQTAYVALLAVLTIASALSVTLVRHATRSKDRPASGDTPLSGTGLLLGLIAVSGTLAGYASIIGTVGGIVAYYL